MYNISQNILENIKNLHNKNPELSFKECGFFILSNKTEDIPEFCNYKKRYFTNTIHNNDINEFLNTECYDFKENNWKIYVNKCDPSYDNEIILKATLNYFEEIFCQDNKFNVKYDRKYLLG